MTRLLLRTVPGQSRDLCCKSHAASEQRERSRRAVRSRDALSTSALLDCLCHRVSKPTGVGVPDEFEEGCGIFSPHKHLQAQCFF